MRNTTKLVAIGMLVGFISAPTLLWASRSQPTDASVEAVALKQFDDAIARYMALRNRVGSEVSGPVKDSSSSQLNDASDALAGAIQRARQNAIAGSIFGEPVAAVIRRRIADAVRTERLVPVLAHIDDEPEVSRSPEVHLRLPVSAQMATMPPALLKVLPLLPAGLEYRILGRDLVLRDVDASLILDYIPAAVPR